MKKEWICSFCGSDTMEVDMDYLAGYDHIACILNTKINQMDKIVKIENWDKAFGLTYNGYSLVNLIHSADYKSYYGDIIDLNVASKPKFKLEMWYVGLTDSFIVEISDPTKNNGATRVTIGKDVLKDLKGFRLTYEGLITRFTSRPVQMASSHSINNGGIIANVMNSGTTIKI